MMNRSRCFWIMKCVLLICIAIGVPSIGLGVILSRMGYYHPVLIAGAVGIVAAALMAYALFEPIEHRARRPTLNVG